LAITFIKSLISVWLERPARWTILLIGVAILLILTVSAFIPINVIGPFDARTYEPVKGVRVEFSPAGAAVEPVTALAHVITEAPDIRAAAISISLWILGLAGCTVAMVKLYKNRWKANRQVIISGLSAMGIGLFVLAVYGFFSILVRIPNWRAISDDPNIVLAELHTHTYSSHDGLISAWGSLRWHAQRGNDVVAVIRHYSPKGRADAAALTMAASDNSLPAILFGVERKLKYLGYIIALDTKEHPEITPVNSTFISRFHQNCQGVVLASMSKLKPGMAENFVKCGIDGFDVACDGHPTISSALHKEVLAAADANQLPMVAWTDWHGIGCILRTWTAIRVHNAAALSREQRAEAVLNVLRRHERANIIPIVIGQMHAVSPVPVIFAPFIEGLRYALSLSPMRVLAWWVWGIALFLAATGLMHLGIHPARLILAAALMIMGTAVIIEGARLIIAHFSGHAPYFFPFQTGLESLAIGITAVISGIISGFYAVIRRQKRNADIVTVN
jgi:hypothetical protein